MKNIAIIKYTIIFEPTETFSSGYQFENKFAKFFESEGFEAQMIEPSGGSGERAIILSKTNDTQKVVEALQKEVKTTPASNQIKQVQQRTPPKDFKQFKNPKQAQGGPAKLGFNQPGNTNRQKVRYG